jgi:hypothetical protein
MGSEHGLSYYVARRVKCQKKADRKESHGCDLMLPFLDTERVPLSNDLEATAFPAYWQVSGRFDAGDFHAGLNYYLIPTGVTTYVIASCFGHRFDPIVELFGDEHLGTAWFNVAAKTYPTFGTLATNALNERYSEGALLRLCDPDDAELKWCVATVVGNIDATTFGDLFADVRIKEKIMLVVASSLDLEQQLATQEITAADKVMMIARGAASGYRRGMKMQDKVVSAADWLSQFA